MSKIEVNAVEPQCGTTLTLGASGDTVTLGSGASQSGFGRTGTVDWDTTPKTANFTAVSGTGYFCNTTSSAITMTMPSGSAGAIVSIQDYNKTFDTNNLTVTPASGEKINGGDASASLVISTEGQGLTFVYVDSTVGWKTVHENEFTSGGSDYISATGGTITCCGDFKIHTFTGPGTFTVLSAGAPANNSLEYIVVAGGGGNGFCGGNAMGGAGAGGFRFASPSLAPATYPGKPLAAPAGLTAAVQAYPITVGAGGSPGGPTLGNQGTAGSTSTFSTISSAGGARGSRGATNSGVGEAGGSGAGGAGGGFNRAAGAGNTPPVSPPQGQPGGNSGNNQAYPDHASGGGGGAICAGAQGRSVSNNASGKGGDGAGIPTAFGANGVPCGSFRYYAGGGAGEYYAPVTSEKAPGGKGGGGNGGTCTPGTANTGGGGGGGGTPGDAGGAGGSGIVVIRYKFQN